jgi:Flp pilus assembly protein TadG
MRRPNRSSGQALTEFALVLPFFALLLFGIIDFSRFVFAANALNNGAREAARFAAVSVGPTECTTPNPDLNKYACAQEVAKNNSWGQARATMTVNVYCQEIEADGDLAPTIPSTLPVNECGAADILTVRTSAPFTLLTPLVGQFLGSITLQGEAKVTVNS